MLSSAAAGFTVQTPASNIAKINMRTAIRGLSLD
jgi:hypothetical protein